MGGAVAIFTVWYCTRCLCSWARRRRASKLPQKDIRQVPHQVYRPAAKPLVCEAPQSAELQACREHRISDDTLTSTPGWDIANHKNVLNRPHEEDLELGRLAQAKPYSDLMLAHQASLPATGLEPARTLSPTKNPFDELPPPPNPFDASSLGENHEYSPRSTRSPERPYSPFAPSACTRRTPSPFTDQPDSRQPSSFWLPESTTHINYVPLQPPYVAYAPTVSMPEAPSLLDEPKSPYRPYFPLPSPRYELSSEDEPQHPFAAYSPTISARYEPSSINREPLELSTPYNKRPQSILPEENLRLQEKTQVTSAFREKKRTSNDQARNRL